MASIEHERNEETAGQLSLEDKARLNDEVIKQAELFLNGSGSVVAENECLDNASAAKLGATAVVLGILMNTSKGDVTTETNLQHQYAGEVTTDYTDTIASGTTGVGYFKMKASDKEGVEAFVVYVGKNNDGSKDCAWLLGFRINQMYTNVYVVCGFKNDYRNLNWDEIKHKIEISGDDVSYDNRYTGTSISASIAINKGEYVILAYLNG